MKKGASLVVGCGIAAALAIVVNCAVISPARAEADPTEAKKSPRVEFSWQNADVLYERATIAGVNNVPLEIRNVPIHRDDTYSGHEEPTDPIQHDSVHDIDRLTYNFQFGPQFNICKESSITAGVSLDLVLPSIQYWFSDPNHQPNIAEQNYGAPGVAKRGVGTALTYYQISSEYPPFKQLWILNLRPGLFAETQVPISTKRHMIIGSKFFT